MVSAEITIVIALITTVFLVDRSIEDNAWCDKEFNCEINGVEVEHTMCKNVPSDKRDSFDRITRHQSKYFRKFILKAHNSFRSTLTIGWTGLPTASNIRQMTWDKTLEELATNWAMQCNPQHDVCRKTREFSQVGQNVGMVAFEKESAAVLNDIFGEWSKSLNLLEEESSVESAIQSFKDGSWSNGTQLAWAETSKIGCGEATCHQSLSQTNFRVVVCNYGPSGNIDKQEIFKLGDPCMNCSEGTQCKEQSDYPNLCALPNDPTDNSLGVPDDDEPDDPDSGETSTDGGKTKTTSKPSTTTTTSDTDKDHSLVLPTRPVVPFNCAMRISRKSLNLLLDFTKIISSIIIPDLYRHIT